MKERLKFFLFSIAFCILMLPVEKGYASHMGGAELSYQWVHDSTYQLFLKFYRACEAGGTMDTSYQIFACSSCGTTVVNTTVNQIGGNNGIEMVHYCPGSQNSCNNPGNNTFPDYEEWLYSGFVTLPSRCDHWTFTFGNAFMCCRNSGLINGMQNKSLMVAATLDNLHAQGNTSPFLPRATPYVCINRAQTINLGGFDINNDSLVYSYTTPKGDGHCDTLIDLAYGAGYSASNPIASDTNNAFTVNPLTGQISFTPTESGKFQLAVEVDEYRNGHKIGSMIKDFQVVVQTCTFAPPAIQAFNLLGGTFSSSSTIVTSPGSALSFDVNVQGMPVTDTVALGGSNINSANGSSYSIVSAQSGQFSWMPGITDIGDHIVSFSAWDSTCHSNGVIVDNTLYLTIRVLPFSPDGMGCVSGSLGGAMDSSDIGRFIIGLDTFGTIYSHLANPAAVNTFVLSTDTIQLYIDSTYPIQEAGIMNTLHDASAKVTLFIDYDGNHNFDIPQERVWTAYSQAFVNYIPNGSITIPSTAIIDSPVVMRLILNNDTGASAASDDGCGVYTSGETEDFIVIFRNASSAVKNLSNDAKISFYPNPNKGRFKMNISSSAGVNELRVRVSSVTGQTILNKSYSNTGRQFSTDIDISSAAKGLYFVETEADGKRSVGKIVVE